MLLSDRDLRAAIAAGRFTLTPYDEGLVQPSSVDVRLDRYFRVFANHRYTHIDPSIQQDDLTELVEPAGDEPFVLHPGEFVLGSTLEMVTLPDDLAGRLEGKALAGHTWIPTPRGWRLLIDLQVGDEVFDEAGQPTPVLARTGGMTGRPCHEVVFSDGSVFIADSAHQWVTSTKAERKAGRGVTGVRTTAQIAQGLRVGGEYNHHVGLGAPVCYPRQDLPVDPYVLGIWLGNGTSTTGLITPADEQIVDEIRAAGHRMDHRGKYKYRIGGADSLHSTLQGMRLLGNKYVPEEYLTSDRGQRLGLLQGLMDSDGYCDAYGRCEFVSMREVLADGVVELAASLGLRPTKRKKRATLYGVDCGPAYQVKFSPHMPVFRLARKLSRQRQGAFHRFRAIVDVRPSPNCTVCCIQVGAESGMYLAGRTFIPTHNSSLGRLGLLTHSTAGFIDPGFTGHVTLELSNVANLPIKLWPGMKIGQLCLFSLTSPAEHPYGAALYGSRYQGQRGPTASRSFQGFTRTPTKD